MDCNEKVICGCGDFKKVGQIHLQTEFNGLSCFKQCNVLV